MKIFWVTIACLFLYLGVTYSKETEEIQCPEGTKALTVEEEMDEEVEAQATNPFTFDDIFDSSYSASGFSHSWLPDSNDYMYRDGSSRDVVYRNAVTGDITTVITAATLSQNGVSRYWLSADRNWVLMAYDYEKLWRYSFSARYKMYDIKNDQVLDFPYGSLSGEKLQIARLGPVGNSVAFVYQSNLYYQASMSLPAIQITTDGQDNTILNGIPDWVYEEDVTHSEEAFYFSKDSGHILFSRFDVTEIPKQAWPRYGKADNYFPEIVEVPIPKPGDLRDGKLGPITNIQLYVFSTARLGAGLKRILPPLEFISQDHYYNQITWRDGFNVLITWVNRAQNRTIQTICDVYEDEPVCTVFRDFTQEGGWVDCRQPSQWFVNGGKNMVTVLQDPSTEAKFKQATLMSTPERGHGVITFRTNTNAEVYNIAGFDEERQHIFYITNHGDTTERMLYRVGPNGNDANPVCLTCNRGLGCRYVSASFSGDGKHYILSCLGPDVPEYFLKHVDDDANEEVLQGNAAHKAAISQKDMPSQEFTWAAIHGGYMGRVMLFKPPDFDSSKKYPLFIYTYAGPESTLVSKRYPIGGYSTNWLRFLSSSHNAVVASIDARGTTGRGDAFTFEIYRRRGDIEIEDQIEAVRSMLYDLDYIDTTVPVAIYGWSGGGLTTASVIGNPSNVIECGISVAPNINMMYYDAPYSERYMAFATKEDNAEGYEKQNVLNKAENFRGKQFLIAHGMADDNVHYMHATQMIKELESKNIQHHQLFYPDTNHGIGEIQYAKHLRKGMTKFLLDRCWKGKYGTIN